MCEVVVLLCREYEAKIILLHPQILKCLVVQVFAYEETNI